MINVGKVLDELEDFNRWVTSLEKVDNVLFFTPIKEKKWTPAEIISHITYWDRYIVKEILPQLASKQVTSVDFEEINTPAAEYALSGVTMEHLIRSQVSARTSLLLALRELDEAKFLDTFTLNGEEIDEYTGFPHTLYNYLASFAWHDNHHKQQIVTFLNEHDVQLV